jgi:putative transposase
MRGMLRVCNHSRRSIHIERIIFSPQRQVHLNINRYRKSIRLKDYDYAQPGGYFITICTFNRECLFGEIADGVMRLNTVGTIAERCWREMPNHFSNIAIDEYVIMPNHAHCIITIKKCKDLKESGRGEVTSPLQKVSLGKIIAYFKYQSTKMINKINDTPGNPVWQRGYYDRIIRSNKELNNIRDYIKSNIIQWSLDTENPQDVLP